MAIKSRLKSLLSKGTPLEWGFVVGLAIPMTIYHIVLRSVRVVYRSGMAEVLRWIDVYKSDVFFHAAFLLFGLTILLATRNRRWGYVAMVVLQVAAIVITQIETVAFRFFMATGSTIDFQLIWFSLSQLAETFDVVASEVPVYIWWMMGLSAFGALTMPWAVAWAIPRMRRRWANPDGQAERPPRRSPVLAVATVVTLGLALTPPMAERSYAFARNATVNVAMSTVWSIREMFSGTALVSTDTTRATLRERDDHEKMNVVVILLESTRARSVSIYNPELETTPNLLELAKSSIVAERAYTIVPHTSKALVASLCGIEPRLNMPITEALPNGIPGKCLARLLGEQGYRTGFFQSATKRFENREQLVENMGYGTFVPVEKMDKRGFAKANYFGHEDDVMLEPSAKWIDEVKGEPFFLTYLTLTPHHDYLAPRRYGRHKFAKDDELNRYLNTVHYVDAFVQNVIDMFKEKGLYEKTIFVIVGDHGEGFGEHGRRQHDNVIWQEGIRVPLVVHDPRRKKAERIDFGVNQLDILMTVTDLLGYDIDDATFPGMSMLEVDHERTLRAHCWYERRCMALTRGTDKFIYHFDQRPEEFFDLATDPTEENDLAESRTDLDRYRSDLVTWRQRVNSLYRQHNESRLKQYVTSEPPVVSHPVENVQFGDFARIVGVQAPTGPVRPGSNVNVTFVFEVLEEPPDGYKLFTHGDGANTGMKNWDHVPVDGLYPLEDWRPGDFVADTVRARVPLRARDHYDFWVGFYHPKEGRAKVTGDIEIDRDRAHVIRLELSKKSSKKKK